MEAERGPPGQRDPLHPEPVRGDHPVGDRASEEAGDHDERVRGQRDAMAFAGGETLGRAGASRHASSYRGFRPPGPSGAPVARSPATERTVTGRLTRSVPRWTAATQRAATTAAERLGRRRSTTARAAAHSSKNGR